jgi:CDP-glucose 4,6-dehydratase
VQLSFEKEPALATGWNFGPNDTSIKPVSWMVDRACKLWGGDSRWTLDGAGHPQEDTLLRLDSSEAERHLEWRGQLGVERAIEWTIGWHRAFNAGEDMRARALAQFAQCEALVRSQTAIAKAGG